MRVSEAQQEPGPNFALRQMMVAYIQAAPGSDEQEECRFAVDMLFERRRRIQETRLRLPKPDDYPAGRAWPAMGACEAGRRALEQADGLVS